MTSLHEIERKAVDNPSPWARKHVDQYLESGGEKTDHPMTDRLILLYVKGRRSGEIRRVPVVHFTDGDDMLIVASKGGAPEDPMWYRNLVANPQVWVRHKDDFFEARAHVLTPEERTPAWEMLTAIAPGFAQYQEKASRTIPVVRLARV
ncbi:MAG TPA: nitroreductase/quinone reductase family protein [Acidimicrobiia bacterium]|jgi:deazaflavin-dependent oxidoreductase (nitroreductase family)